MRLGEGEERCERLRLRGQYLAAHPSMSKTYQVFVHRKQDTLVVFNRPKDQVAALAKKSPYDPCHVIMVYLRVTSWAIECFLADKTCVPLSKKQALKIANRNTVGPQPIHLYVERMPIFPIFSLNGMAGLASASRYLLFLSKVK